MQKQQTSADKIVRDQIKKKDYQHITRIKKEMQSEQENLKNYFTQFKKPTQEDPTIKRKERYRQKIETFSSIFESFRIFNFFSNFWKFQPSTPQETQTLNLCRKYVKSNLFYSIATGLAITSFTSYYNRMYFGIPMKIFGVVVGVCGGGAFGLINSTKFVLEQLQALGPEYRLGRLIQLEIEDYRMDKKIK